MIWKGHNLITIGDLMKHGIDQCETPEEARAFMKLYSSQHPHAKANIGYIAGYYSQEDAQRIYEWFQVEHPIFGTSSPTPEEAFKAGLECGKTGKIQKENPWELKAFDILENSGL